ncbi:unnamed protein product [Bacillus thuringiensis DB27]|uniref:Uncharacterized protein n=1 Tax=Bacillus thuringiensis DB27 TaxID=1431339 RepID=W8ZB18_BACTU|nr:unnamed protein product [Bacillus thuringiensis DB27]
MCVPQNKRHDIGTAIVLLLLYTFHLSSMNHSFTLEHIDRSNAYCGMSPRVAHVFLLFSPNLKNLSCTVGTSVLLIE